MADNNQDLFSRIRETNRYVVENAKDVKLNYDAMDKFLDNLDLENFKKKSAVVHFPLLFDTVEEEVNFLALLDLLNFGSGFRKELHKYTDRGAYETICYGVIGMQISGRKLDAEFLSNMTPYDAGQYFAFPITVEKELQPALRTMVPSELRLLGELIAKVLKDTASILRNRGYDTLGKFVIESLTPKGSNEPSQLASTLIENLINTFPAFRDMATYKGKEIMILKKVQLLAADLYRRFGDSDSRFKFKDIENLTVFTDNVLPCVLRQLGILELSEDLAKHVDSGTVLKPGDQEVELRVLAMVACDEIVTKAKKKFESQPDIAKSFTAMQLDYFLWTIGKDTIYRAAERHYTQETVFY